MSIAIHEYRIVSREYGQDFAIEGATATVILNNYTWHVETRVENVPFYRGGSDDYIACKAAAMSGTYWVWPWWKRSLNRKLKYLKKNGVK